MFFKSFFYLFYVLVISRFKVKRKDTVVDLASVASLVEDCDNVCALIGDDLGDVAELTRLVEQSDRESAKSA